MLNKYRNMSVRYRYDFVDKNLKITLIYIYILLKKKKINKLFIYNGNALNEKKLSFIDVGNYIGNYVLTRRLYAKPEKFFKFKYIC